MFEKHKAKKLAGSGGVRCRATVLTAERGNSVVPSSPQAPPHDPVQLLTQLAQLRTQGMLSDAEYETQKARLLGE
jgi:hypothetical protein